LTYVETDSETQKSEEFDYVVLAFPIHEKSVMKADPEIAQVLPEARPYVKVDFTHFHGDLSSQIFPLPKAPVQKGKKASGCFSALSLPGRTPNPGDEIPNKWDAFPIFNPGDRNRLTKFVLADGLIYVNAIEQLASNMEFALIGGYNAALLIAEDRISRSN
uniref:Prenylcys_lyase domain-containing protein n=1 Tax=Hymenolepis diminuta TaxID=6216 RepID=A0A0R3SW11_HYMDI